jgi:putative two-component system response regulator
MPGGQETATILVVDDTPVHALRLRQILQESGYSNVVTETDPWKVIDAVAAHDPSVIFLDLDMPGLDGFGVLQLVSKELGLKVPIPVVVTVDQQHAPARERALAAGAYDFIARPFDSVEVSITCRNALRHRLLATQAETGNVQLQALVRERTDDLDRAQIAALEKLAQAADYRDDEGGEHARRVGQLSGDIALALGVSPGISEMIKLAAPLHDLGKVGIPDSILLKPGALTDDEMGVMKSHTEIGAAILTDAHPVLWLAGEICLAHHERWDGSGYPKGLVAEDIPLPGRIVGVADVFDTLTCDRPFRKAWPRHRAIAELLAQSGQHFDPRVVDAFLKVERREFR